ncbi:MAG: cob(I)yrinic acid a,c-diamide adenosyltransferase [Lawsonibacter sp.]
MVHLYCGDGKGKTTAAMGLALRMAGHGRGVVIAQFLKGSDTGERNALALLPQVTLLPVPAVVKFSFALTPEERLAEAERAAALLTQAGRLARDKNCGLLVLDEVCSAVSAGLLPLEDVLGLLNTLGTELVLTGREAHPALEARADYITRYTKIRHPYDKGVQARPGIEF